MFNMVLSLQLTGTNGVNGHVHLKARNSEAKHNSISKAITFECFNLSDWLRGFIVVFFFNFRQENRLDRSHFRHWVLIDDKNNKIAILYLNTNNGYTLLEDGTKIPSVKNKLALFDNVSHTDVTCTDTEERVVLNIGYILWLNHCFHVL